MKEYMALRLHSLSEALTNCNLLILTTYEVKAPLVDQTVQKISECLTFIGEEASALELKLTAMYANRLIDSISSPTLHDKAMDEISVLRGRFEDELASIQFLHVDSSRMAFYQKTDLFGQEFKEKFPKGNAEVIEAGNCFALARYTASVFHLMRALEMGTFALMQHLDIPPTEKTGDKNWKSYSDAIKKKLEDTKWQKDAIEVANREFALTAVAFFDSARGPIRNATAHVDVTYDEDSAERVFGSVKAFMSHLSTKIGEEPYWLS